ncbi:hypothetical protein Tsubulata_011579 [Turnera subulata]|uniref:Pentacotripeptide-repeat region of PRORP domain-containing protein n=1 Tax=Turnera subulata TaxID=218843 RepID=A0A9Q0GKU2_9ROSI|nr:hypothetical protein Tsubulata_011579 [Turnera subulata]
MEGTKSFPLSLHPHIFPPKPSTQPFKTRAAAGSKEPTIPRHKTDHHHHRGRRPNKSAPNKNHRRSFPNKNKNASPYSFPLHHKNPQGIYRDIKRFAREDKLKEALVIMDYMDQQGVPVNVTTFSALIAAGIRAKSLPQAKEIHVHVRINGLENNEFLRTRLVQMYTSCGSFEDARKVFDECNSSGFSVYPWNALLRGTVVSGGKRYSDVLATYAEMRASGVELNEYSFANVLKSFAGSSKLKQGLKTHALLIKNGLVGSQMLATGLIDMYFKCGSIKLAHKVFEEMPERDIVLWGAMIAGFAHNRRQWQALDYVRWMVSEGLYPNSVILTMILPVMGEMGERRLGKEVHAYIVKTSVSERLSVQCGLVDMYCKCGDLDSGRQVFYASRERNTVTWTALTSGYISFGRLEQAVRSVIWMQQEGFRPDVVTVATVVPVCAKLRDLRRGKELHAYAIKHVFFPNVSITTSLMKMYSNCGVLDYSAKLFDGMEKRNVKSWTAMIDVYVEHGCVDDALSRFRSMQSSKYKPDSVTIARMLRLCRKIRASKLGKELHGRVLKSNFEYIPSVSAEIIKMYGSCGLIHSAIAAFEAVPAKGSIAWTATIESYGYNRLWNEAIELFDKMISRGCPPTHFTFSVVLSVCDQAGFADEACRIFKLVTQKYKISASEEHYSVIIGLLMRSGRTDEAQRYVEMSSSSS